MTILDSTFGEPSAENEADCLPPQRFGNFLAIYNETVASLALLHTGTPTDSDVLAARVWAFNAGAAPLDEWYPPETWMDDEGRTWTTYSWDQ